MLDEVFAYLIFQRKRLLDDFVALSFAEMKAKMRDHRAPFVRRQFFCPAFIDEDTKLPRAPAEEECHEWATGQQEVWMNKNRYDEGESSFLPCAMK